MISAFTSQGELRNASPGFAPTVRIVAPRSFARPLRCTTESRTKTIVLAGASISCPSTVNVACPSTTT